MTPDEEIALYRRQRDRVMHMREQIRAMDRIDAVDTEERHRLALRDEARRSQAEDLRKI